MANSGEGDKFGSLIIPNCQRIASQEDKLQSCPFVRESKVLSDDIHSSSSTDDGIAILTLPESSDEYHTPPEHHSSSHNSSNDRDPMPLDDDTHTIDRNDTGTEIIKSTHQVFVEMPEREHETCNREKRKLPFSMKAQKQNIKYCKHEIFTSSLNRVLKMVESRGGDDVDIDVMETAKMRGLTLPLPRWWPAGGFKD